MKKFTWKKLMSLVLVAALVIGVLQMNARRVSAEDSTPTIGANGAVAETSEGLNPAIVYAVEREAGQISESHPITIAMVLDASGSMLDTIAQEAKPEAEWTWVEWFYNAIFGYVPQTNLSAMDVALVGAKSFTDTLGSTATVKYIAFNNDANAVDSLDQVSAKYNTGTNIDAALELASGIEGVDAVVILTDGQPTYATVGEGGIRFGSGSSASSEVLAETENAVTRLTEKGVTIYAINYGHSGNFFENLTNDMVKNYSSDFDANSLKAELDKIAVSIKEIYATDARIEAKLGNYVEYAGDKEEDGVEISEDGTTLTWPIADYNKDAEGAVINPSSPDLKFRVVVTDSDNNKLTEQDDVVKALLALDDPETDEDQIVVEKTTDEKNKEIVTIKIAVTAKGQTWLYYSINGVKQPRESVTCTATETITIYSGYAPVEEPETHTYMINYFCGEDVVAVSTGSAVLPYKAVADYANAVANEGFDKADYEVKEGATLEFDLVAGSDNVFAVELVKKAPVVLEVEYKVNYKAGDDLVASYTDSIADGSDIQAKALTDAAVIAAEGFDKTKYEVVAGQELTFHVTVDLKEFDVEVQLKKVDPKPTDDPGQKIEIIFATPTPTPTPTPDPEPTDVPTPTPTEEPTPSQIPVVDIEEIETPEGDVDLEETETPQAAPEEEELDVEPIDTPQGDLPQTGVAPTAVFFGLGAACVLFGGVIVLKNRRKEEM